jgi:hypothetical protein
MDQYRPSMQLKRDRARNNMLYDQKYRKKLKQENNLNGEEEIDKLIEEFDDEIYEDLELENMQYLRSSHVGGILFEEHIRELITLSSIGQEIPERFFRWRQSTIGELDMIYILDEERSASKIIKALFGESLAKLTYNLNSINVTGVKKYKNLFIECKTNFNDNYFRSFNKFYDENGQFFNPLNPSTYFFLKLFRLSLLFHKFHNMSGDFLMILVYNGTDPSRVMDYYHEINEMIGEFPSCQQTSSYLKYLRNNLVLLYVPHPIFSTRELLRQYDQKKSSILKTKDLTISNNNEIFIENRSRIENSQASEKSIVYFLFNLV